LTAGPPVRIFRPLSEFTPARPGLFVELGPWRSAPSQGLPHRAPQGPRLRDQQDQPALQGPPGL